MNRPDEYPRPRVLAVARRAGRRSGVPGAAAQRVPLVGRGDHRSGRTADVPETDGRVARAGGHDRLHQAAGREDRSLRSPAGGDRPRAAAVLRDRDDARRRRHRPPGRKPRRPARRRSRATPSIPTAWARPTSSRRPRCSISTIRIARRRSRTSARFGPGRRCSASCARRWSARMPVQGAGLRILTESLNSPTLGAQLLDILARYPAATWHQWDPAGRDSAHLGAKQAFGEVVDTQYRIEQADVILALDADFLASGPASLRYAREFSAPPAAGGCRAHEPALRRREHADADRIARRSSAAAQAERDRDAGPADRGGGRRPGCGRGRHRSPDAPPNSRPDGSRRWPRTCSPTRAPALVIAGDSQPARRPCARPRHQRRARQRRARRSCTPSRSIVSPVDQMQSMRDLATAMTAGQVDMLIILGGNPVYTAPADLEVRAMRCPECRCASTSARTRTRPRSCHTGTSRSRTSSRAGATRARSTAPCRSSSR